MSQWTDSAKARLEQYFANVRGSLAASGVDADEVTEDLRRHIEEEVGARKLTIVTEHDAEQILSAIGAPEGIKNATEPARAKTPTREVPVAPARRLPGAALLSFGVIIPAAVILFEFFSGACAGMFFNPVPTLWHVLLAGFVPAANLLTWSALRRGDLRHRTLLGWANGAALAISLGFTIAFLPLTPFALASIVLIVGILFYGIGLAPLGPAMALFSTAALRRHLRRSEDGTPLARQTWGGFALGFGALLLCTLPLALTQLGLHLAASEDPAKSTRGVRLLRWAGNDEILLHACYGRAGRAGELYAWGKPIQPETARFVYYRVHGQPFNAVPPPKLYAGRARWDLLEQEFTWDNDQAGDSVAARVRGLGLVHSRQDAVIEPETALAYIEWTLEFKNDSSLQRESRAQILLPPGGVVSRLTLWIDGEEREAAFGGRSQVKTAYKSVVRQRRDPVLVTTCGPDRVLMQCYPVPPNGGRMKVRLGITAPLALTDLNKGHLRWPAFAERNFSCGENLHHSLWVESPKPLETSGTRLKAESGKPGHFALRGQLNDTEISAPFHTVCVQRSAGIRHAWTRDSREDSAPLIQQTISEQRGSPPDRVVVVVDGSKGVENFYQAIGDALPLLPPNTDFALLLARDGCENLVPLQKGRSELYSRIGLMKLNSHGGHDNTPALLQAWELASAAKAGVIVWIHGPQPVTFESVGDLRQRFERSSNPPRLYDVEIKVGPNRILEKLDGLTSVGSLVRLGNLGEDLARLFKTLNGSSPAFSITRQCASAQVSGADLPGKEASLHLARLWASAEVARLSGARELQTATELAVRHQLVTPLTGAVVLETQAQYESAGLQPVPAQSVPVVPEPSSVSLLMLSLVVLFLRRWRAPQSS